MKTLGFDSSDDDDDASSPSVVEAPASPNVVDEPGSPKVVDKPPTPPGTWPKHLPPPTGACEGVKVYKFYHNAYTVMAGAMYEHNFLVAGVMLDDRDITKPSAFLVLVEAACPSKGVRLLWFDPELPPHTEYNMTHVGASRLSKNVDSQVRRWVADEDKFQASVDDAQSIDFVVEKFVGITEEDGETRVKARFAGWSAGFDVWYKLSDLDPAAFNLARKYLEENSTTPVTNDRAEKKTTKTKKNAYTDGEDAMLREWGVKVCSNDKNAPTWAYISKHLFTGRSAAALRQRFSVLAAQEDPAHAVEQEVLNNRSALRKRRVAETRKRRSDAAKAVTTRRKSQRQATLDEHLPEHAARAEELLNMEKENTENMETQNMEKENTEKPIFKPPTLPMQTLPMQPTQTQPPPQLPKLPTTQLPTQQPQPLPTQQPQPQPQTQPTQLLPMMPQPMMPQPMMPQSSSSPSCSTACELRTALAL